MKRSHINQAIMAARHALEKQGLRLPAFAYWTMAEWTRRMPGLANLREIGLGWDVTDFGSGDFPRRGATLFTLRNGKKDCPQWGTPYAEKIIFLRHKTEQEIPLHYHTDKTEDIINRGGGILMLELYNALPDGGLDLTGPIGARLDGIERTLAAGSVIEVAPGDSITLTPRLFHRFWAKKGAGDLVVGEVSSVNDDSTDNTFFGGAPRFSHIEEDEPPLCPLCNEYGKEG